MRDLDTPLNGLLLPSGTLCILRIHLDDDPQWGRKDEKEKDQDDGEDAQQKTQEDGQEEEEGGGDSLADLPAGLGRPLGRHPSSASRPPSRPRPGSRPAALLSPPAFQPAQAGPQACLHSEPAGLHAGLGRPPGR